MSDCRVFSFLIDFAGTVLLSVIFVSLILTISYSPWCTLRTRALLLSIVYKLSIAELYMKISVKLLITYYKQFVISCEIEYFLYLIIILLYFNKYWKHLRGRKIVTCKKGHNCCEMSDEKRGEKCFTPVNVCGGCGHVRTFKDKNSK